MSTWKWTQNFLNLAKHISSWSKDPSTHIGAVAVDPDTRRVLSTGYNGFPRGVEDSDRRLNDKEAKYKFVVHAEQNCIYNATLNGVSLNGADLYVHGLPVCSECAKGVIQVGIKRVFICHPTNIAPIWQDAYKFTKMMFAEAGVMAVRHDFDTGKIIDSVVHVD